MISRLRFSMLILGAILLSFIPYAYYPFSWMQTFFHEMSHGVAVLLTGGKIVNISLDLQGSGVINFIHKSVSQVSMQASSGVKQVHPYSFFVWFVGYPGATVWGAVIYLGGSASAKVSHRVALVILVLMVFTLVFWTKDLETGVILFCMGGIVFASLWYGQKFNLQSFVQFMGIYILTESIQEPFKLLMISSDTRSDASQLAGLTSIPSLIWIMVWILICFTFLILLWKRTTR